MDLIYKSMLTAAMVAVSLMALRLFGGRVAGLLAGLPTTTGPALAWLAFAEGTDFALVATHGSLASSAAAPLFLAAVVAGSGGRRGTPARGLATGLAVALCAAWLLRSWHDDLAALAVAALGTTALAAALAGRLVAAQSGDRAPPARRCPKRPVARRHPERPPRRGPWLEAACAGGVTLLTGLLADRLGGYGAGFLAALPLVGACTLWQVQRAGPRAALAGFLRGYAVGNASKTAFVLAMALALPRGGALMGTLSGAAAAVIALVLVHLSVRRLFQPEGSPRMGRDLAAGTTRH